MSNFFKNWELHKLHEEKDMEIEFANRAPGVKRWQITRVPAWCANKEYRLAAKTRDGANIEVHMEKAEKASIKVGDDEVWGCDVKKLKDEIMKNHDPKSLIAALSFKKQTKTVPWEYDDYMNISWEKALRCKDDLKEISSIGSISDGTVNLPGYGCPTFKDLSIYWELANGDPLTKEIEC